MSFVEKQSLHITWFAIKVGVSEPEKNILCLFAVSRTWLSAKVLNFGNIFRKKNRTSYTVTQPVQKYDNVCWSNMQNGAKHWISMTEIDIVGATSPFAIWCVKCGSYLQEKKSSLNKMKNIRSLILNNVYKKPLPHTSWVCIIIHRGIQICSI